MIGSKLLLVTITGSMMAIGPAPAVLASDTGACQRTPTREGRQSWKEVIAKQLHNHDPANAAQGARLAAEIIDDNAAAVVTDIHSGVNPNATLKLAGGDMTLLELAVAACNEDISRELVGLGASPDGLGTSVPIVTAGAKGDASTVEFLIQHGAKVDKQDSAGHTALEDAVRQHKLGAVKVLLKYDADVNRGLAGGATILDLASNSQDPTDKAIADELTSHGAVRGARQD